MHPDLRTGALIVGAVLVLAAALSGKLPIFKTQSPAAAGRALRLLIGLIGVGLFVWVWLTRSPPDPVASAKSALLACHDAAAPALPNGDTASLVEMTTARKEFQAYDAAVTAYMGCVDSTLERVTKQATGSTSAGDLAKVRTFQVDVHNAAVDREKAAVDKFNAQLRLYKVKHSGQ